MDVRLTAEQQQLRDAAAKLADDLGPATVQDLDDQGRISRLDKQIEMSGWRSLRSDGASGVEVAIVAEEFGRRLVDTPFLGPVLADDLLRHVGADAAATTVAVDDRAVDARGARRCLAVGWRGPGRRCAARAGQRRPDPGRRDDGGLSGDTGEVGSDVAGQWRALALVTTTADLVGVARARTRWPATTRKSVSSTVIRSGRIKPSRTCWRKALR